MYLSQQYVNFVDKKKKVNFTNNAILNLKKWDILYSILKERKEFFFRLLI